MIYQIISQSPIPGQRGIDTRNDFVIKTEAFFDYFYSVLFVEMNQFATETNNTATQINTDAINAEASASASANSATNSANSATASANSATASANSAVDASNTAQSIGDTAYALSQIGISFASVIDGDLIITYQDPITDVSFNADNELIITY